MKKLSGICFAASALLAASPFAQAHHSYAMFDDSRLLTASGTIAKLEWSNPHVFIWVYVPKPGGGYTPFAFESDSVNRLASMGWTREKLAQGDKISIEYRPLRDGRPGGSVSKITLANGTVLNTTPRPANTLGQQP